MAVKKALKSTAKAVGKSIAGRGPVAAAARGLANGATRANKYKCGGKIKRK